MVTRRLFAGPAFARTRKSHGGGCYEPSRSGRRITRFGKASPAARLRGGHRESEPKGVSLGPQPTPRMACGTSGIVLKNSRNFSSAANEEVVQCVDLPVP
jgi:hypothetical protein